jgi:hypothetical protein
MCQFDPHKLAHYEKDNYVAYYRKDWLKLLRVSIGLVKESFGLSFWQAIYAAYLVARGEIAFAPFPDNDVPKAEAYIRRFYRFIRDVQHEILMFSALPNSKSTGGASIVNCLEMPKTRSWWRP